MTQEVAVDRRSVGDAGRRLVVLGAWLAFPVAGVAWCRAYEAVRAAAWGGQDAGRVANWAWYQLVRAATEHDRRDACERLVRYGWYGVTLVAAASSVLLGVGSERRWVRRGGVAAVVVGVVVAAAMLVDAPGGPGIRWATPLKLHVALGGLAVAAAVWRSGRRVCDVPGTWRCALIAVVVAAIVSGFTLAGWRAAQVQDLMRQRRDLTHAVTGAAILMVGVGALVLRRKPRGLRCAATAAWVLAVAAVVWTGVLMTIDGSDGAAGVWRLRAPVVQDAGMK